MKWKHILTIWISVLTVSLILGLSVGANAAGWTALPVTSNDWYSASGAAVMSQSWSGLVERCNICAITSATNPASHPTYGGGLVWIQTLTVSTGTNIAVVTNGGWVYTNTLWLSTNIVTTNQFGPLAYSYNDLSGAHTATAFPFVTSAELFSLCRYFYEQWGYPVGGNGVGGGIVGNATETMRAVNRTVEVSTNFDNWFATADGANYPQALPYWSTASLMQYTGAGKAIEVTNDAFGLPIDGRGFFTRYPGGSRYILGELHFTGTWARVDSLAGSIMGTLRQTNEFANPALQYIRFNTNLAVPSYTVVLTGEVVRGLSTISYMPPIGPSNAWGDIAADFGRTNGAETVSSANAAVALSFPFAGLSTFSCATTAAVSNGDVIVAYWTNEPTQYMNYSYAQEVGLETPNVDYRLWAVYLNEVYSNMNALTWWGKAGDWSAHPVAGGDTYLWTASSTDSWAAAVTACEAANSNLVSLSGPCCYTTGSYDTTNWIASAYARRSEPSASSLSPLLAVRPQFYVKAVAPTASSTVYSDTGYETLTEGKFCLWNRTGAWTNYTSVTGAPLGQVSLPAEWCAEPTIGTNTAKGWVVGDNPQVVLEYDVEGGLQYTP